MELIYNLFIEYINKTKKKLKKLFQILSLENNFEGMFNVILLLN